jgi:beta-phosphoglucomutase-like phosphatase (HAD superfamily)
MIECVIFDCDGTLVDSEMLCNLGLEIKLKELGIQTNIQSMMEQFRG